MEMDRDRMDQVEARLAQLAGRCRRLQVGMCALVLSLAVLLLGGADALNRLKSVEAEQFVLRDAAGKRRGLLGLGEDGNARLSIFDRDEKEMATLGVAPDGAAFVLVTKGDRVATLGVDANGVPRMELMGEGRGGASLFYHPDSACGLYLRDKEGHERVSVGLAAGGLPQFMFFDADEKMRLALGGAPDQAYSLMFLDAKEEQRLALGLAPDRKAHIDLFEHPKGARLGMSAGTDGVCEFTIQDQAGKPRIGLQIAGDGSETQFRLDDGRGESGITLRSSRGGRVYQRLSGKGQKSVIAQTIDESGTSGLTIAEDRTRTRLGLSVRPGSHAIFYAKDLAGKDRAVAGVDAEGEGDMRVIAGDGVDGDRASLDPQEGRAATPGQAPPPSRPPG